RLDEGAAAAHKLAVAAIAGGNRMNAGRQVGDTETGCADRAGGTQSPLAEASGSLAENDGARRRTADIRSYRGSEDHQLAGDGRGARRDKGRSSPDHRGALDHLATGQRARAAGEGALAVVRGADVMSPHREGGGAE